MADHSPNYELADTQTLPLIYHHKRMLLSTLHKEGDFPENSPEDKSQLIAKINEIDTLLQEAAEGN